MRSSRWRRVAALSAVLAGCTGGAIDQEARSSAVVEAPCASHDDLIAVAEEDHSAMGLRDANGDGKLELALLDAQAATPTWTVWLSDQECGQDQYRMAGSVAATHHREGDSLAPEIMVLELSSGFAGVKSLLAVSEAACDPASPTPTAGSTQIYAYLPGEVAPASYRPLLAEPLRVPCTVVEPSPPPPQTVTVTVAPNGTHSFSPSSVSIHVGDTVAWVWEGNFHTVTSGTPGHPDGLFCSNAEVPSVEACAGGTTSTTGHTYSFTFTSAGAFPYYCKPHAAHMTGTVVVTQ
jgi:plastocyanin